MKSHYKYSLLKTILNTKVGNNFVWKKRIQNQIQYIHLLEEAFGTEISSKSFGFYPNKVYFGTSLTADPAYTVKMKPVWLKIKKIIEKYGWDIYTPFILTDPHAKTPDNLSAFDIRDLDHIQVLTAEVAFFDLNRPSHGVGQEIELSVFMPKIGFSKERISRITKGMPGFLIINYQNEDELIKILEKIFARKNFKKEPFYVSICNKHPTPSVFKGRDCLNCQFTGHLHI